MSRPPQAPYPRSSASSSSLQQSALQQRGTRGAPAKLDVENFLAGKYLTFLIAEEQYGLSIQRVQEIIGIMPVTTVPRAPYFVRGVINLRGRIYPTIDLRLKFDLSPKDDDEKTCIIIAETIAEGQHRRDHRVRMGLIVDEVSEVLDVEAAQINAPPEFGVSIGSEFILGVGMVDDGMKFLLDIDKVLSVAEVGAVERLRRG